MPNASAAALVQNNMLFNFIWDAFFKDSRNVRGAETVNSTVTPVKTHVITSRLVCSRPIYTPRACGFWRFFPFKAINW